MNDVKPPSSGLSITVRLPSFGPIRSRLSGIPRLSVAPLGRGRWRAVLVALIVVAAVGNVLLHREADHQANQVSARAAAMKSAEVRIPAMLSYSYTTIDGDLAVASGNTTGPFHKSYGTILRDVVAPNAIKKKITTSATVSGASVVSGDDKNALILVFVTQSTLADGVKKPSVSGSRINVKMTKTSKGWFVSQITPI